MPHVRPLLACFALTLAVVGGPAALAEDARAVTLPLASGHVLEGVVESADASEVVVRTGPESVRRVPWAQLEPLGVYRVKAALAPAANGDARLALAELAVELGLHKDARVEFEKALALGAIDRAAFQKVVAQAETDAVEVGTQSALLRAESGDMEGALALARDLKLHFSGAPNARQIDRLINALLDAVRKMEKENTKAARELERVALDADRNKEILRRSTEALQEIDKGRQLAADAAEARERGNVTRSRKYAEQGDEAYMKARRHLGRLRRVLPAEHPERKEVLARLNELDALQFDLLFRTAQFMWDQRVYSQADEFAARASYIDPVFPDLLDLREVLRASRIRYRFSDVTNARPRIR